MNDLKDILTDIIELIQHIAYKTDDLELLNDAKDLYDKIMEVLDD